QTSGAATDSSPAQDAPEVTVIGKRLQNLRDVAGTVNVLGAKELTDIGAKDAEDIFKLAPGVQFNKGSADGAMLTIRGIGTNTSSDNTSTG
ncbi:TonB-dependent receptor plug domain-containing protein, partial [Pandoraea pneumonica]